MHDGKKLASRGGRPRKFREAEALGNMQRQLWTTGFSGASLHEIARSAGLNRPSLAAAFGDKDAIYARAALEFGKMMEERLSGALQRSDLAAALAGAFEAALDVYTAEGAFGCFVICTAPAEAHANPMCRDILDETLQAIDALFLRRLEQERAFGGIGTDDLTAYAVLLGATLQSLALRARAGWDRDRLLEIAEAATRAVVAALETSRK